MFTFSLQVLPPSVRITWLHARIKTVTQSFPIIQPISGRGLQRFEIEAGEGGSDQERNK